MSEITSKHLEVNAFNQDSSMSLLSRGHIGIDDYSSLSTKTITIVDSRPAVNTDISVQISVIFFILVLLFIAYRLFVRKGD